VCIQSGAINLFTVRHEEGKCHHVLRQHKAPVSVLKITQDETGCVSGSWDKTVLVSESFLFIMSLKYFYLFIYII